VDFGFIRDSKILVEKEKYLKIQLLRKGDVISGFVSGKLFPVQICYLKQHFALELIWIKTEENLNIKGGFNQPILISGENKEMKDLQKDDLIIKSNSEMVRVKDKIKCGLITPLYVIKTSPAIPFVVNEIVVGNFET
jgi:hypothetical protein